MNWRPKGSSPESVLTCDCDDHGGSPTMEADMKVVAWNVAQNARALSITPAVRGADIYLLNEAPPALELGDLLMKADDRTIALDCPHEEGLCTCKRRWSAAVAVP